MAVAAPASAGSALVPVSAPPAPAAHDLALSLVRRLIDGIDDAAVALLAGRRRLVGVAARRKAAAGLPARDPDREGAVRARAQRLGARLGVPEASSGRLLDALIADACDLQGVPGDAPAGDDGGDARYDDRPIPDLHSRFWLRLLPPPWRWRPLLATVPAAARAHSFAALARRALREPLASGLFDPIEGRRVGIAVSDLGLAFVVCVRDRMLHVEVDGAPAEAVVCGSAVDLLLLASRREDADTLFFQRRLQLTGDVDLGLTARNLLDQLPWQDVPLGARIVLHRAAGLAADARAARRGGPSASAR
ncbi:MAG: SCP2 sterol-binding domain-containing protein [Proteobacteria bacterium]|nr:SCP2 sterol-binding domain-containing protein [Pseudomonadota bacterium]